MSRLEVLPLPIDGSTPTDVVIRVVDASGINVERHDLLAALNRAEMAVKMLESGFDFRSAEGSRYLPQLADAVRTLKSHSQILIEIYDRIQSQKDR